MLVAENAEYVRLVRHISAVRRNIETIARVKHLIQIEDYHEAILLMDEISNEDKTDLWRATTKGSIWTPKERQIMRSNEWFRIKREL